MFFMWILLWLLIKEIINWIYWYKEWLIYRFLYKIIWIKNIINFICVIIIYNLCIYKNNDVSVYLLGLLFDKKNVGILIINCFWFFECDCIFILYIWFYWIVGKSNVEIS